MQGSSPKMHNKKINIAEKVVSSDLVCLAEITSPHGIRGNVKLKTYTQNSADIALYKVLKDRSGAVFKFRLISTPTPYSAVVALQGVDNRNQAEMLRGIKLYVTRAELPELEEEEFYHTDLIGMDVLDQQGNLVGQVQAVQNHGAGDFLDILTIAKEVCSIPFRKESVPFVDVAGQSITINSAFLLGSKA